MKNKMAKSYHFPEVTLLITHYNRSSSLGRLLKSLKDLSCSFGDIVVSDDGSRNEHLEYVKKLQVQYVFNLVTTPVNKGLGNNINKGQDAVKTPYTLYIQEDFIPANDFAEHFDDALNFMKEKDDLDIIRFYAYIKHPYLKPYGKGFSEMLIKPWSLDYYKIYLYSDQPHLRRSSFLTKFGRFPEGLIGDRTEYHMCISFIQKGGKGLFYDDYKGLLIQDNPEAEPSTMDYRDNWKQSSNIFISFVRSIYRQIRYNYDILFMNTDRPITNNSDPR